MEAQLYYWGGDLKSLIGKEYSVEEWVLLKKKYSEGTSEEKAQATVCIYYGMEPFIKDLAKKNYGSYLARDRDDLLSAGKVGLFNGIGDYDPQKAKPTTWFGRWILNSMFKFISIEYHHTTPYYRKDMREIYKVINKYEMKGISCTTDDIVRETGYPKQTVDNCMFIDGRNKNQVSIDALREEGKGSIIDSLAADIPDLESALLKKENKERIKKIMESCLNETELKATQLHYGFFNDQEFSYADIAVKMGLREQDIGPILNRARKKLGEALRFEEEN